MTDLNLSNQRILIREDFNVPMKEGVIADDTRICRAIPTIKNALEQNAAVILVSHFGRPEEGVFDEKYSLAPVAARLSELLGKKVRFEREWINGIDIEPGELVLCENVRFLPGEKTCSDDLSKKMAALCDVFVMDAFAAAHRAHASTVGIVKYAPKACAGLLLDAELSALSKALLNPEKPFIAVVGGAKVSTKISILKNLLAKVDVLIVGGGIANTCLAANGVNVGASLVETDFISAASELMTLAKESNVIMPLPTDVRVAKQFSENARARVCDVDSVASDEMILDVGPKTEESYKWLLQAAKTIVWNGPVGVFEFDNFANGTKTLANAIANSLAFSVAGGGDTLAAISLFHLQNKISYISTGGGAFLEWMEGRSLPAIVALSK